MPEREYQCTAEVTREAIVKVMARDADAAKRKIERGQFDWHGDALVFTQDISLAELKLISQPLLSFEGEHD